ncbi:MAG: STAS domain-containing protein, partial [Gammaproteobacteria bacterium]|nr:STAS domain-containing protein [Gammaproteobacteria bacterium]
MSEFTLEDRGDGHFALSGEMTFDTAEKILAASGDMFDEHTQLEVDLSEVTESDSAGLALLLEWVTWANHSVREIRFTGMPER